MFHLLLHIIYLVQGQKHDLSTAFTHDTSALFPEHSHISQSQWLVNLTAWFSYCSICIFLL